MIAILFIIIIITGALVNVILYTGLAALAFGLLILLTGPRPIGVYTELLMIDPNVETESNLETAFSMLTLYSGVSYRDCSHRNRFCIGSKCPIVRVFGRTI